MTEDFQFKDFDEVLEAMKTEFQNRDDEDYVHDPDVMNRFLDVVGLVKKLGYEVQPQPFITPKYEDRSVNVRATGFDVDGDQMDLLREIMQKADGFSIDPGIDDTVVIDFWFKNLYRHK